MTDKEEEIVLLAIFIAAISSGKNPIESAGIARMGMPTYMDLLEWWRDGRNEESE